jgi:hypothetical protein
VNAIILVIHNYELWVKKIVPARKFESTDNRHLLIYCGGVELKSGRRCRKRARAGQQNKSGRD